MREGELPGSTITITEMVFPQQTNHHHTLFGGVALSMMDKAAFLAATRVSRRVLVTAHSDRIDFVAPAARGMLVEVSAAVAKIGNRSLEVQSRLMVEDLLSGKRYLGTEGRFVMVATDSKAPIAPTPLVPFPEVIPSDTFFSEIIFPEHTNHYGTLFGGTALSLMGKCAFIAGTRATRRVLVMAASDRTNFTAPIKQGEAAHLRGRPGKPGRSSLPVSVELWGEDLSTGAQRLCASASFIMVAVNAEGRPEKF